MAGANHGEREERWPKAPRESGVGGVSPSPPGKGPIFSIFSFKMASKFWCVLGANFIAFELSVLHA